MRSTRAAPSLPATRPVRPRRAAGWARWALAALGALGALAPLLVAQAAGSWVPAAPLATGRTLAASAVLADGSVVVTGGEGGPSPEAAGALATAERFDPASGTWSTVAPMSTPREVHTETLLDDGTVLVVGGRNGTTTLATAERFDPASGAWRAAGTLTTARTDHTATRLQDGRVLVVGGANDGSVLATAELYDPATNVWRLAGTLATGREDHTATLLPDGRVLVAGGDADDNSTPQNSAELFDPASGTWSDAASMTTSRITHTATLVQIGGAPMVLVVGGNLHEPTQLLASAELYDPTTNVWNRTNNMSLPRTSHSATRLANGTVLVAGGRSTVCATAEPSCTKKTAEVFDPTTRTWSAVPDMSAYRLYHTADLLPDGRVLVSGGSGVSADAGVGQTGGFLALVEVYQSLS